MQLTELALRFILGGFVVALVSALGSTRYSLLAGLAVLFPVITATGYYFLGQSVATPELREIALFSILGLTTLLAFLLALYWALPRYSLERSLGVAMFVWFVTAALVILVNRVFFQLGNV